MLGSSILQAAWWMFGGVAVSRNLLVDFLQMILPFDVSRVGRFRAVAACEALGYGFSCLVCGVFFMASFKKETFKHSS